MEIEANDGLQWFSYGKEYSLQASRIGWIEKLDFVWMSPKLSRLLEPGGHSMERDQIRVTEKASGDFGVYPMSLLLGCDDRSSQNISIPGCLCCFRNCPAPCPPDRQSLQASSSPSTSVHSTQLVQPFFNRLRSFLPTPQVLKLLDLLRTVTERDTFPRT